MNRGVTAEGRFDLRRTATQSLRNIVGSVGKASFQVPAEIKCRPQSCQDVEKIAG
jgi:hypothetical protein